MKPGGAFGLVLELGAEPDEEQEPASERVPAGLESAAAVLRDALNNGSATDVARALKRCWACCGGESEGYDEEE